VYDVRAVRVDRRQRVACLTDELGSNPTVAD
jgi:hypothetical protein